MEDFRIQKITTSNITTKNSEMVGKLSEMDKIDHEWNTLEQGFMSKGWNQSNISTYNNMAKLYVKLIKK
jgi:hypothetical protein